MNSDYKPPLLLWNGHLQTMYPALFRKITPVRPFIRERIDTPDGDFLDLDWMKDANKRLIILNHGLEGNSDRTYMIGMANTMFQAGYDVLAWNYRGCSGEMNRLPILYHSGATYDLQTVTRHVQGSYEEIHLIGFSLGGNLVLKFLGESDHPEIKSAATFSVPLDLRSGAVHLSNIQNLAYSKRFLRSLKRKALMKHEQFPGIFDLSRLNEIKSVYQFDDLITSPIHGFDSAEDYYRKSSSMFFLPQINTKTLIVNSINDPFLPKTCLDLSLTRGNQHIHFEVLEQGGHCGFPMDLKMDTSWAEKRAMNFITGVDYNSNR
jgi:hypothetical protein